VNEMELTRSKSQLKYLRAMQAGIVELMNMMSTRDRIASIRHVPEGTPLVYEEMVDHPPATMNVDFRRSGS